MIRGIFEKNGETTELVTNGMTEIAPEIHIIPMRAKKRIPHRRIDHFTPAQAVFSGIAWGMPLGILLCTALSGDGALKWWSIASMAVSIFWVWQNYGRKR